MESIKDRLYVLPKERYQYYKRVLSEQSPIYFSLLRQAEKEIKHQEKRKVKKKINVSDMIELLKGKLYDGIDNDTGFLRYEGRVYAKLRQGTTSLLLPEDIETCKKKGDLYFEAYDNLW